MSLSISDAEMSVLLRLASEVADLPADATVRRRHILETLRHLVDAEAACCFEASRSGEPGLAEPGTFVHVGPLPGNGDARRRDPATRPPGRFGWPASPSDEPFDTRRRPAPVDDRRWYQSAYYTDVLRPLNLEESIYSRVPLPGGRVLYIGMHRAVGDDPFTDRHCQLVQFFNTHAARLYHVPDKAADTATPAGTTPASPPVHDPRIRALPPRLRPVLLGFLDGEGEKQVATKLGLSPHTVHQYAKLLYRHFDVSSRGELLSQFVAVAC